MVFSVTMVFLKNVIALNDVPGWNFQLGWFDCSDIFIVLILSKRGLIEGINYDQTIFIG